MVGAAPVVATRRRGFLLGKEKAASVGGGKSRLIEIGEDIVYPFLTMNEGWM
jgi:hypothetical protein